MDFETILAEQREELEHAEGSGFVPREALPGARKALAAPNILAILGVRRCGKSVFSYLLAKGSRFGYVNFDDERLLGVRAADLNSILKAMYASGDMDTIILDEVQNVPGWELFANRLRRTKKVILTGSNSTLLSGELATRLTGRHLDITLYPYSFREFLAAKGAPAPATTRDQARTLRLLEEYLRIGGFPEAQAFGSRIAASIYEDIVAKDVLLRIKAKKTEELRKLASYLVTSAGQEFSFQKAARALSIKHVSTASKWTAALEEAFLVFRLPRFDFKLRQQFLAAKKVYCTDPGILAAVGFAFSENKGVALENAVAVELRRRARPGDELYYWKDVQQREVDFVVKRGPRISQLIQATWARSRGDIRERELAALQRASAALRCNDLLVITWDHEGAEPLGARTVRFVPLWKWLLEPTAAAGT